MNTHTPEGPRVEELMETLSIQELRMHKRIAHKLAYIDLTLGMPDRIAQERLNAAARFHKRLVARTAND